MVSELQITTVDKTEWVESMGTMHTQTQARLMKAHHQTTAKIQLVIHTLITHTQTLIQITANPIITKTKLSINKSILCHPKIKYSSPLMSCNHTPK